jgi:hypothetical protein
MSLAPGERLALAWIEDALRYSDPRLAAMLATFTLPRTLRLRIRGERLARSRVGRVVAVTIALAAMCVSVLAWLLPAPRGQPACPPGRQPLTCQAAARSTSQPAGGASQPTRTPSRGQR